MQEAVETKPKKEQKKEKKAESAGLSHDELKELEDLAFGEYACVLRLQKYILVRSLQLS